MHLPRVVLRHPQVGAAMAEMSIWLPSPRQEVGVPLACTLLRVDSPLLGWGSCPGSHRSVKRSAV